MNDAIAGLLVKLHAEDRIRRCTLGAVNRGGWELTDSEFALRRDDVSLVSQRLLLCVVMVSGLGRLRLPQHPCHD